MSRLTRWLAFALLVASLVGLALAWMSRPSRASAARRLWRRRYHQAVKDPQLRANLLAFQQHWREVRDAGFGSYDGPRPDGDRAAEMVISSASVGQRAPVDRTERDFRVLRHEARQVKDRALDDAVEMKRRFRAAAEKAGAVVYEARTADDATRYILDLARRRGVKLVAKSKSMVSEEIGLNYTMQKEGLRVVETDLGEWIVQLAGEHPSHMVAPAIHKSRHQVAALMSQATGQKLSGDNLSELTAVARRELRQAFLSADMGLSGANALIAETGTVMMITNEGNGRLVTSVPPVHVVLAGWEKLVPTMAEATDQLRVLARSGTGQALTSYTTFITGPDRPGHEMHIVLLDNGRSEMYRSPEFRDALRCIRCGACADVCPPYQVVGGHVFGYVYTGAIGLVTTPFHHGLENDAGPQSLCVSCNACATVCPVDIPLPRQILDVRQMVVEAQGLPWYKRIAFEVWSRPALFDLLARAGSVAQAPLVKDGFLRRLPIPRVMSWRTLPALASRPARDVLANGLRPLAPQGRLANSAARGLKVAYFIQCITDRFYPDMAEATVKVLRACGAEVVTPTAQHCCGLTAFDSGDRANAIKMAKQTIEALEQVSADYVVSGAASCVAFMIDEYPRLLADDPLWLERARRLCQRLMTLTVFLDRVARLPPGALANGHRVAVTYHDFCQSHNVLGIREEPRRLIRDVLGLDLREMEDSSVCCGFGGAFSLEHPRVARHIVERKLANADATQAEVLVTDNPGCIMHLRGTVDASGRPLRVLHIAELIAERLPS